MKEEHVLKDAFEGIKLGPGKYRQFSAAPTVNPTIAHMHFDNPHAHDLATVSKENN